MALRGSWKDWLKAAWKSQSLKTWNIATCVAFADVCRYLDNILNSCTLQVFCSFWCYCSFSSIFIVWPFKTGIPQFEWLVWKKVQNDSVLFKILGFINDCTMVRKRMMGKKQNHSNRQKQLHFYIFTFYVLVGSTQIVNISEEHLQYYYRSNNRIMSTVTKWPYHLVDRIKSTYQLSELRLWIVGSSLAFHQREPFKEITKTFLGNKPKTNRKLAKKLLQKNVLEKIFGHYLFSCRFFFVKRWKSAKPAYLALTLL